MPREYIRTHKHTQRSTHISVGSNRQRSTNKQLEVLRLTESEEGVRRDDGENKGRK